METDRANRINRQKGQGIVRALHESELANAGNERVQALRRAEDQLDRIARLLPGALEAGVGMTEIARITGVSRPTLYELRARYADSARDLRLAVLQALMRRETSFPDALPAHLGRPESEIAPVIRDFLKRGWITYDESGAEPRALPTEGGLPLAVLKPQRPPAAELVDAYERGKNMIFPYVVTVDGFQALEEWKFDEESRATESDG